MVRRFNGLKQTAGLFELFNLPNHPNRTFEAQLHSMKQHKRFALKVMPDQVTREQLDEILEFCTDICYLYREDFSAQVESWVGHLQWAGDKRYTQARHPKPLPMESTTQDEIDKQSAFLESNYAKMAEIYKSYPAQKFKYEDIAQTRIFHQSYFWNTGITFPAMRVNPNFQLEEK